MNNYLSFVQCDENARTLPVFISSMAEQLWSADTSLRAETHRYTLLYCMSGTFYIKKDKKTEICLKEKQVYLIQKDHQCILCTEKDMPCQVKLITFDGSGVSAILAYLNIDSFSTISVNAAKYDSDFDNLFFDVRMHHDFRASINFQQLLSSIFNTKIAAGHEKNLDLVNRYILENFCSDIDVQTLAGIYGTSVSYLCRAFKKHYDISPIAYVNQLRLEKARRLLITTTKKVQDIAVECGFINSDYFCSTFKKHEFCTPLQYRRHNHAYNAQDIFSF